MMIDLHSHVLHAVDDGADSLETALDMLRIASNSGIRAVVATPHILDGLQVGYEETVVSHFRELCRAVTDNRLEIDVYLGAEIHFQFGMEDIIESSIGTYRGMGRYFLVETPLTHYPKRFEEVLMRIISRGKKPIFAHPERVSPLLDDVDTIARLVYNGVYMQVNSGSIIGRFGSNIARFASDLIDRGLVHFIGSDAHSTSKRGFNLEKARDYVEEQYGEDLTELLFYTNPRNVLFSEQIEQAEPAGK
jgi:protein-tyrosine phosphatase